MDLPPPNEPTTVEVQKMDQKQNLIQKIRKLCEETKDFKCGEIPCSLSERAYFLDVCNAANANEIFSFKCAHFLLYGCRDGLESRVVSDYGINPEYLKYHIDSSDIFKLDDLIRETGKGTGGVRPISDKELDLEAFEVIYTIMVKNPDFMPKFTTFTFGGTLEDLPPLRDGDGNPNMEFFRAWKQKTDAKYSRE